MSTLSSRKSYISEVRQHATDLLAAYDRVRSAYKEWQLGMNAWLDSGDFVGENEGLTIDDVATVMTSMFEATDSFEAWLAAGHGTNLEKVRF